MEHFLNICNVDGGNVTPVDVVTFGSPCFVAGTSVLTDKGYKNIEDIQVGDMVLTHENRYRPVLKVGGNKDQETYLLKAQGVLPTQVTGNHPYFVRNMKRDWDGEAKRNIRVFSDPEWKPVDTLRTGDFVGVAIPQIEENPYNLTEEECWLIGRYIADGCIGQKVIIFTIGRAKEKEFLSHCGGCNNIKASNQYEHSTRVEIRDDRLLDCLDLVKCGHGAMNKVFSETLINLPISLAQAVLDGYMSGDGCFSGNKFSVTSVSRLLVMSLQRLVAKIYRTSTCLYKVPVAPTTVIEGRTVNQNTQFQARFRKEVLKQNNSFVDGEYIWYPIHSVEKLEKVDVFNIEVDEDNSYTANNAIVHNCQGVTRF